MPNNSNPFGSAMASSDANLIRILELQQKGKLSEERLQIAQEGMDLRKQSIEDREVANDRLEQARDLNRQLREQIADFNQQQKLQELSLKKSKTDAYIAKSMFDLEQEKARFVDATKATAQASEAFKKFVALDESQPDFDKKAAQLDVDYPGVFTSADKKTEAPLGGVWTNSFKKYNEYTQAGIKKQEMFQKEQADKELETQRFNHRQSLETQKDQAAFDRLSKADQDKEILTTGSATGIPVSRPTPVSAVSPIENKPNTNPVNALFH